MRNLYKIPLLTLLTGLCMALLGTSCSSDEPAGGENGAGRQPARADIRNASALLLYTPVLEESRAIDGVFDRAGLYRMDPDGKVSMVAIYCSTDEDGNTIEHNHKLTLRAGMMETCSDYIILSNCEYCDEDGDIQDVGASHILINKLTGDIYDLSDVISTGALNITNPGFHQAADGSLLMFGMDDRCNVGRITISGRKAVFKQLNNGIGFIGSKVKGAIHDTPSGLIVSAADAGLTDEMAVLFPNGGYDYLSGHTVPQLSDITTTYDVMGPDANALPTSYIWLNDSPVAFKEQAYGSKNNANEFFLECFIAIMKINTGSQPGQVSFTEGNKIHLVTDYEKQYNRQAACAIGDNLLVELKRGNTPTYLVYNSTADKWVNMGSPIEFVSPNAYLNPSAIFNNRVWITDIPNGARAGKVWWIDPVRQQTGSLDVDLAGVDVQDIEEDYEAGRLIIRGVRRSDSYNCILSFDLATGKSELLFSTPDLISINMALLS